MQLAASLRPIARLDFTSKVPIFISNGGIRCITIRTLRVSSQLSPGLSKTGAFWTFDFLKNVEKTLFARTTVTIDHLMRFLHLKVLQHSLVCLLSGSVSNSFPRPPLDN